MKMLGLVMPALTAGALVLSACNTSSTSSPVRPSTITTISGEYIGTLTDSVAGAQTVATTLAQHDASIGGTLTLTSGTTSSTEAIAWTIASDNTVGGTGTMSVGAATCTFAMTGTYDGTAGRITGTYRAVQNCSGRTGSYTLNQQCANPAASADRRTLGVTQPC